MKIGIVGEDMEMLLAGEKGQIIISGICLAKCYRNNDEETAKHFVTFKSGERAYLTGDIGYLDVDGNLHCCGRMDNQIKYKGYRIELDEIRKAFLENNSVADAVILFMTEEYGSYLAAAVCTKGETDENILKEYLSRKLPAYMIPQKIRFMDSFPLNRNKKVDTKAIREIIRSDYIYSCNRGNSSIHDICRRYWAEILCIQYENVPDDVPFKELGGDSLRMLTMMSDIGKRFEVGIPFEDFIAEPTLSRISKIIEKILAGE